MRKNRPGYASIIIRSKSEEKWIGHCLKKVFDQKYAPGFEVIIVDNLSTDDTLRCVNRFPVKDVKTIDHYLPGKALNLGIESASGDFIVMLSAHCVPKENNWLESLLVNFDDNKIAGVYGRQVPVSFSTPMDVRDMTITFGLDRRVQTKDSFFHNANGAIRRALLDECPFNDEVTNIEDRLWASEIIKLGYQLVYEPKAVVFHHHGLHQNNSHDRADSTFAVLNNHKEFSIENSLPDSMKPENLEVVVVIPAPKMVTDILGCKQIAALLKDLRSSRYKKKCFVLYDDPKVKDLVEDVGAIALLRDKTVNRPELSLGEVLLWGLKRIEEHGHFPDAVLYTNPVYIFRPKGLFDLLLQEFCYKGLDSAFPGYADYQNYWVYDKDTGYREFGEGTLPRNIKRPIYKAVFGLGCITHSGIIRKGKLTGKRVGIIPIYDIKYTLKVSDPSNLSLIRLLQRETLELR